VLLCVLTVQSVSLPPVGVAEYCDECVGVFVCHKPVLYQNDWTDLHVAVLSAWRLPFTYPTLCFGEIREPPTDKEYFPLKLYPKLRTQKTSLYDWLIALSTKLVDGRACWPGFRYTTVTRWWRGTVVERRSLAGELSLSCARPAADGWPLLWVRHPLLVSQLGQLSLSSFRGR